MYPSPPENLVALDGSASAWCGAGAGQLESIVHAARQLAPGTHAGIGTVERSGALATIVSTDALVSRLDELQRDLDEGPSLTVNRDDHAVVVDDAESEHRWPRFMSRAVGAGLRTYLGMPIPVAGTTSGVLNLYSTVHLHLDAEMLAAANLFAARAGVALEEARRENDLVLALQSSRTIGKAIGLLMERFDLDDHEAFEHLTDLSRRSDVELRDVAAHFVKQANDVRHLRTSPPPPRGPARGRALAADLPAELPAALPRVGAPDRFEP